MTTDVCGPAESRDTMRSHSFAMRVSNLESGTGTNEGDLSSVADHDTIYGAPENDSPSWGKVRKEKPSNSGMARFSAVNGG